MRKNRRRDLVFWVGLMCVIVISGCRISSVADMESPGEAVKKRAKAYWVAIEVGKFQEAYENMLCNETKESLSMRDFIARMARVPYSNIEVLESALSPDGKRAEVQLRFDVSMMGHEMTGMKMRQEWMFENGQWRLRLDLTRTPFE